MELRVGRLAALLRAFVWIGIGLLMVVPVLRWHAPELVLGGGPLSQAANVPDIGAVRWVGFFLELPPFAIVAFGLAQVLGFVTVLRQRTMFSAGASKALRRFGWSLIAASAILPLSRALVWLYIGHIGEAKAAALPFAMPLFLLPVSFGVVFGLIFVLFGALMTEASRLAEENASFL